MTAPVQMTGPASGSTIEPRGLMRHSADPTSDVIGTSDTNSSEGSSSTDSTEQSDSADHSSFGSVLKKYFAPPSKGAPSSHNQDQASPKKDSVTPDPLATVPVQTTSVTPRQVLPFALSLLSQDQNSTDTATDSKAPEPARHAEHANPDLAVIAPLQAPLQESSQSQSAQAQPPQGESAQSPLIPTPQVVAARLEVAQALAAQVMSSQLQATQAQAAVSQAILTQTANAAAEPQPTHLQAAPNQSSSGSQTEPLAFAVKLSPSQTETQDETAPKATDTASAHSQTTASNAPPASSQSTSQATTQANNQVAPKEMPTVDAAPAAAQSTDASADRAAAINSMPLPSHAAAPSEPAESSSVKGESHPVLMPTVAHIEPAASKPVEPSSSSRDFTVRIPDATERGTNVRFVERGTEVHVSVRTADSELAQLLRGGLGDLTGKLQHTGVQAEVWRPGSQTSNSDSQNASQNESSDQRGSGGRRNQSGAQRDGQDQPSEDKPRWVEELESFGAPVLVKR